MLVVDASVAVKWFIPESGEEAAAKLLGGKRRLVHLVSNAELYDDAVQMAFLAKHALADCMYLVAAKRFEAPVITADKPMLERGSRVYRNITFLGDAEKH